MFSGQRLSAQQLHSHVLSASSSLQFEHFSSATLLPSVNASNQNFLSTPITEASDSLLSSPHDRLVRTRAVHGTEDRNNLVCVVCKKSFALPHHLQRHVKNVHLKNFLFSCAHCGRGFNDRGRFTDHVNMHSGIQSHQCPHCAKRFTFKSNLGHHLRNTACNK